jgi:hypothetical protein
LPPVWSKFEKETIKKYMDVSYWQWHIAIGFFFIGFFGLIALVCTVISFMRSVKKIVFKIEIM